MRAAVQHWGATGLEIGGHMPGDHLITGDPAEGTRSLTLDAHPEAIFDHLFDMGLAESLNLVVAHQVQPHTLVMTLPEKELLGHRLNFTLAYRLVRSGPYTRIVTRTRVSCQGTFGSLIERVLLRRDAAISKRQLLSLKARVEPPR